MQPHLQENQRNQHAYLTLFNCLSEIQFNGLFRPVSHKHQLLREHNDIYYTDRLVRFFCIPLWNIMSVTTTHQNSASIIWDT